MNITIEATKDYSGLGYRPIEPTVFIEQGKVFASSWDVAEYFSKRHNNVARDIRKLIEADPACALKFEHTSKTVDGPRGGTRDVGFYTMDRDGFMLLVMGFTGRKAMELKLRYIAAFNEMEAKLKRPVLDDQYVPEPKKTTRLPAKRRHPVDQMDDAMDLLVTIETALSAPDWHDRETIEAIRNVVGQSMKILKPVRDNLDI